MSTFSAMVRPYSLRRANWAPRASVEASERALSIGTLFGMDQMQNPEAIAVQRARARIGTAADPLAGIAGLRFWFLE